MKLKTTIETPVLRKSPSAYELPNGLPVVCVKDTKLHWERMPKLAVFTVSTQYDSEAVEGWVRYSHTVGYRDRFRWKRTKSDEEDAFHDAIDRLLARFILKDGKWHRVYVTMYEVS